MGPFRRRSKNFNIRFEIIRDSRVILDRNSDFTKSLANPLTVRVQPLSAGQFVTNRDNFRMHRLFSTCLFGRSQYLLGKAYNPSMVGSEVTTAETADPISTSPIRLEIDGMNCAACVAKVEDALLRVDGVSSANVNLAVGEALVKLDHSAEIGQKLKSAVQQAGFIARIPNNSTSSSVEHRHNDGVSYWRWRFFLAGSFLLLLLISHFVLADSGRESLIVACLMQFYVGWPYLLGAIKRLRHFDANMDSLVAVGTMTAFLAGLTEYLTDGVSSMRWLDGAMILTFITLGKSIEAMTTRRASDSLRSLIDLAPKTAVITRSGREIELPIDEVSTEDTIIIRAGDRVPLDAIVTTGSSSVDQSWLTGEPLPAEKKVGDELFAGTINQNGLMTARVIRLSSESTLAQVVDLVKQTQSSKANIQRLADRVVRWFVPIVLLIATATFLTWWLAANDLSQAISSTVAVLVVACPCAMGLATPTAVMVGSGRAADKGILFRDAAAIEQLSTVDTIVFDKTGTLTLGEPSVTRTLSFGDTENLAKAESGWLALAASAESRSSHPLAGAITQYAKDQSLTFTEPDSLETIAGLGVRAQVNGTDVLVGNEKLLLESNVPTAALRQELESLAETTVVCVAVNGNLAGALFVEDTVRPEAKQIVAALKRQGFHVSMLTGDRQNVAKSVGERLGLESVISGVLPIEKSQEIDRLQQRGHHVAMVGDGINDAVALAAADVGISLSAASDVAVDSADVILYRDGIGNLGDAITLAKRTVHVIKQNLMWAFGYNGLLIPLAAGVLVPFGWPGLPPIFAAAAMAASSTSVVLNSLRLRSD